MTDPQTIASKLMKRERTLLLMVSPKFEAGEYFRPDDGLSATVFANLVRKGIFDSERLPVFGTVYCLTDLGLSVRTHLEKEPRT